METWVSVNKVSSESLNESSSTRSSYKTSYARSIVLDLAAGSCATALEEGSI